jgi:hypothetical protein
MWTTEKLSMFIAPLVGEEGLEPSWIAPHVPKTCAYTNSATRPYRRVLNSIFKLLKSHLHPVLYGLHCF